MARMARVVVPSCPHHVTRRGHRRQQTFFNDGNYAAYLELMAEWCRMREVEIGSTAYACEVSMVSPDFPTRAVHANEPIVGQAI